MTLISLYSYSVSGFLLNPVDFYLKYLLTYTFVESTTTTLLCRHMRAYTPTHAHLFVHVRI